MDGLIPIEHEVLLIGQPHSCKSWFIEQLSICVATGEKFLGDEGFTVHRGSVILIDEDTPTTTLMQRLDRLCSFYKVELSDLSIKVKSMEEFRLSDSSQVDDLIREIYSLPQPVLVVIDSLSRVMGVWEEDKTSGAKQANKQLNRLKATGATLLVAHHMSLKQNDGYSQWDFTGRSMGSTQLIANCDTAVGIWRIEQNRPTMSVVKAKERRVAIPASDPFTVRLREDILGKDWSHLVAEPLTDLPSENAKIVFPLFRDQHLILSVDGAIKKVRKDLSEPDVRNALHELERHGVLIRNIKGQHHMYEYNLNPDFSNPMVPMDDFWEALR